MTTARQIRQRTRGTKTKRSALEFRTLQTFRVVFGSARRYDASVRRMSGIPGSLLWALSAIAGSGEISVGALSASMALHQTTASNLVNELVSRGLIERCRSRDDKRVALLSITTKGRRVLKRAPRPHAGLLRHGLTRLDTHRLAELQDGLAGLVAEMRSALRTSAGEPLAE
jgi:DNA-binding MarR family transcriptional regulator